LTKRKKPAQNLYQTEVKPSLKPSDEKANKSPPQPPMPAPTLAPNHQSNDPRVNRELQGLLNLQNKVNLKLLVKSATKQRLRSSKKQTKKPSN
jgi:hypothetical protein